MNIAIHSIRGTRWQGAAEKVICQTPLGQITVLDHHIPLIASIFGPAVEIVGADGKREMIPVSSGFIEVLPGSKVVILASA